MIDSPDVYALLDAMAKAVGSHMQDKNIEHFSIVGIHTGGVWLAEELRHRLKLSPPIGALDISFYRDDFTRKGLHPQVAPSSLPFGVDNAHILLVDDVIMSGRTVRAAMNELFDYGRPASITYAVLIDLCQRELPVCPDIIGTRLAVENTQRIKLVGPENLHIQVRQLTPQERQH